MADPKIIDKEEGKQEIEIPEEPIIPVAPETPTFEELQEEGGLSKEEIEAAGKHGLAVEKKEEKKDPDKKEPEQKAEDKKEPNEKKEDKPPNPDEKPTDVEEAFSDPEKENNLLKKFNKNEYSLYWKMKKERQKRQTSETEKEHLQVKIKALQDEIDRRDQDKGKKDEDADINEILEDDDELKGDKKPPAKKDKKPDPEKEKEEKVKRGEIIRSKLKEHEIDAKTRYEDFDSTVVLTDQLLAAIYEQRLEKVVEAPHERSRIIRKVNQFFEMISNAHEIADGEFNTADMAYEIGKLHPNYKPGSGRENPEKKSGDMDPEKVKKIVDNADKRSSAALSGGASKRTISVEDITVEQAAKLTTEQFGKLPKHVRQRLLKEMS